jgi:hypothetical protein
MSFANGPILHFSIASPLCPSPSTAGNPARAEGASIASAGWKPKKAENVQSPLYREMESKVRWGKPSSH